MTGSMNKLLVARLANHFVTSNDFVEHILRHRVTTDLARVDSLTTLRETLKPAEYKSVHYALNTNRRAVSLLDWLRGMALVGEHTRRSLDIGAGYGGIVGAFADSGVEAVGVEIEKSFYDLARKNIATRPNATIIHGDILEAAPTLMSFDFISCIDVLEHVANPEEVMACISRMLNSNGTFLIRVPNCRAIENVLGDIHHRVFGVQLLDHSAAKRSHVYDFPKHPYTIGEFFSLDWYRAKLRACGFTEVSVARQPHEGQFTEAKLFAQMSALAARLEAFIAESKYDWFLRTEIRNKCTSYLSDYAAGLHGFLADGDESFITRFVDPVWNLVGRKS